MWLWCWIVCSCGSSPWLCWWAQLASSFKLPPSTMTVYLSIRNYLKCTGHVVLITKFVLAGNEHPPPPADFSFRRQVPKRILESIIHGPKPAYMKVSALAKRVPCVASTCQRLVLYGQKTREPTLKVPGVYVKKRVMLDDNTCTESWETISDMRVPNCWYWECWASFREITSRAVDEPCFLYVIWILICESENNQCLNNIYCAKYM